jgi:hypothetical protein
MKIDKKGLKNYYFCVILISILQKQIMCIFLLLMERLELKDQDVLAILIGINGHFEIEQSVFSIGTDGHFAL